MVWTRCGVWRVACGARPRSALWAYVQLGPHPRPGRSPSGKCWGFFGARSTPGGDRRPRRRPASAEPRLIPGERICEVTWRFRVVDSRQQPDPAMHLRSHCLIKAMQRHYKNLLELFVAEIHDPPVQAYDQAKAWVSVKPRFATGITRSYLSPIRSRRDATELASSALGHGYSLVRLNRKGQNARKGVTQSHWPKSLF